MIALIIITSITVGLFIMANKIVHEYEYGMRAIEDFERYNKDSFYFK